MPINCTSIAMHYLGTASLFVSLQCKGCNDHNLGAIQPFHSDNSDGINAIHRHGIR